MSNPDQPLTRRQLKELRRTGQLPVIAEGEAEKAPAPGVEEPPAPAAKTPEAPTGEPVDAPDAPSHEPAAPAAGSAPAVGDAEHPLTRKQARERRSATNQIPVVPEDGSAESHHVVLPAGFESASRDDELAAPKDDAPAEIVTAVPSAPAAESWAARALREAEQDEGTAAGEAEETSETTSDVSAPAGTATDTSTKRAQKQAASKKAPQKQAEPEPPAAEKPADVAKTASAASDARVDDRPQVGSSFGAAVFQQAEDRQKAEREKAEREAAERREAKNREAKGEAPVAEAEPGSGTGEIAAEAYSLSQDSSGSTAGNTSSLILKDMPGAAALSAPITATGELILTSSHTLPEGLGAHGAAKGTTDGKDVDDGLIDGELPEHSSPTPVAASRAVSTSKAPGEVIRPPAPEKNRGLMLTLGITAGVLGIALVGVVVYVFATGQLN